MSSEISIGIIGASGRLGRSIAALALANPAFRVGGAFAHGASPSLHRDLGMLLGLRPLGLTLTSDLGATPLDLYIDVSLAPAHTVQTVLDLKRPLVIGSTGLSPEDFIQLRNASKTIPLFYTANFSLGMALLCKLTREAARLFHPQADIDLIETHHKQKKDAPSGSALALAAIVQESHPLHKTPPIHAIRSGKTIGEHELRFNTIEEQLILSHQAHSRDAFASGALAAARFLIGKPAGFYTMDDLLL